MGFLAAFRVALSALSSMVSAADGARAKLFPDLPNPVGQLVRVDRLPLRVVGVLEAKGSSPIGGDQDDQIFVPLHTLQRKIVGEESLSMIRGSCEDHFARRVFFPLRSATTLPEPSFT